jgi:hypothetical protein
MRLEVTGYTLEELTEATEFYRDMAGDLAALVEASHETLEGNAQ